MTAAMAMPGNTAETFENDEARRSHFLGRLRQGLEELHAELGGVPYAGLFDNCAVLHNRTAFEDHDEPHLKRHLMRLWLMDWDGRPTRPPCTTLALARV